MNNTNTLQKHAPSHSMSDKKNDDHNKKLKEMYDREYRKRVKREHDIEFEREHDRLCS